MKNKIKTVLDAILLAVFVLLCICFLSGCSADTEEEAPPPPPINRFEVTYQDLVAGGKISIIHDNETDRNYLFYNHGCGGGMTLMPEEEGPESLGVSTVTAYCACAKCTGKSRGDPAYGITSTGTVATQGRTVAADPSVIAPGSKIALEGPDGLQEYIVEDSGVEGNTIDIYFNKHEDALIWGIQEREVFLQ